LRGKPALALLRSPAEVNEKYWTEVPQELPFNAVQRVNVDAAVDAEGKTDGEK